MSTVREELGAAASSLPVVRQGIGEDDHAGREEIKAEKNKTTSTSANIMVAVLFDLEGTLVQTPTNDPDLVLEFRARTREKLLALGIPLSELEVKIKINDNRK